MLQRVLKRSMRSLVPYFPCPTLPNQLSTPASPAVPASSSQMNDPFFRLPNKKSKHTFCFPPSSLQSPLAWKKNPSRLIITGARGSPRRASYKAFFRDKSHIDSLLFIRAVPALWAEITVHTCIAESTRMGCVSGKGKLTVCGREGIARRDGLCTTYYSFDLHEWVWFWRETGLACSCG